MNKIRAVFDGVDFGVGDLIRSQDTPNYVNLVIRMDYCDPLCVEVHSVRFAHILDKNIKFINGHRVRPFKLHAITKQGPWGRFHQCGNKRNIQTKWHKVRIVEEVEVDVQPQIDRHISSIETASLYWKPNEQN